MNESYCFQNISSLNEISVRLHFVHVNVLVQHRKHSNGSYLPSLFAQVFLVFSKYPMTTVKSNEFQVWHEKCLNWINFFQKKLWKLEIPRNVFRRKLLVRILEAKLETLECMRLFRRFTRISLIGIFSFDSLDFCVYKSFRTVLSIGAICYCQRVSRVFTNNFKSVQISK